MHICEHTLTYLCRCVLECTSFDKVMLIRDSMSLAPVEQLSENDYRAYYADNFNRIVCPFTGQASHEIPVGPLIDSNRVPLPIQLLRPDAKIQTEGVTFCGKDDEPSITDETNSSVALSLTQAVHFNCVYLIVSVILHVYVFKTFCVVITNISTMFYRYYLLMNCWVDKWVGELLSK